MNFDHSQNMRSVSPDVISGDRVNPRMNKPIRIDPVEIRRTLSILSKPEQVFELRIQDARTKDSSRYPFLASGYFNNSESLIKALSTLHAARGIYITLQPCNPVLLARAQNRLRTANEMRNAPATSDAHIVVYRWLLIDVDPD
ncbi:MAG TPA: hypothetical protein VEL31_30225, partial [Ktedonobacteraceae bacterium]|nr:hypothetical protein [Ktedonobacteraceae bacterium]